MHRKKLIAAGVHVYTSLGLPLALVAVLALRQHHLQRFLIALWLAVFVDSTDGMLARRFDVKGVLPSFNGRRLDDIVDYITYTFLPALALVEFGVLPGALWWVAVLPLLASAYGFCQEDAKTTDSFVGFPSYWNVVFLYLCLLSPPAPLVVGLLVAFSALVFVPIRYIYPSHTRWLKRATIALGSVYGLVVAVLCIFPDAGWARNVALASLLYPAYYSVASLLHHRRVMGQEANPA